MEVLWEQQEFGSGWEGYKAGSVLTGSGTSPQILAAPGADGLASSPTCYVQFWWLQLLRHLVKSTGWFCMISTCELARPREADS